MKALDGVDGLGRESRQDRKLIENLLAVRLNGFAPEGSRWSRFSLHHEDRNTALRECQTQDRPAATRPHHYNVEIPVQSGAPISCGRSIGGRLPICNEPNLPGLPITGTPTPNPA
jgi:hypothetical protein